MTPSVANRLNALVLLIMGIWGVIAAGGSSPTTYIAPVFGLLFLLAGGAFAKGNKAVVHVVVLLTFVLVLILAAVPMRKALGGDDILKIIRTCTMVLSGIVAAVVFIKSFIDTRRAS